MASGLMGSGGVNRPAPAPPGVRAPPPGIGSGGGPPPLHIQNRPLPGPPGGAPMAPM